MLDDPQLRRTTFIVIDFEGTTPRGHPPEPTEVAAVGLRRTPSGWRRTASFSALMRLPEHAPLTPAGTAQTGITARMLADRPAAGPVLAALDARLTF